MHRSRNAKIVATLGPASSTPATILAGLPFGHPGNTNLFHIARLGEQGVGGH